MFLDALVWLASLLMILLASILFTNGIELLGHRLKMHQSAVGSVLAAVGTALPETVVPIIAIDKHTGRVEITPEIVTRGFLPSDDGQEILTKAREVILKTIEQSSAEEKMDWSVIKEKIRVDLKRYLNKQTSKRPLILPVILEV